MFPKYFILLSSLGLLIISVQSFPSEYMNIFVLLTMTIFVLLTQHRKFDRRIKYLSLSIISRLSEGFSSSGICMHNEPECPNEENSESFALSRSCLHVQAAPGARPAPMPPWSVPTLRRNAPFRSRYGMYQATLKFPSQAGIISCRFVKSHTTPIPDC